MTNFRNAMIALAATAALFGSQALAADVTLAPGKPAGVTQAQNRSPSLLLIGGAVVIATIAVVVATQGNNSSACGANCTVVPPTST